jgi:hypothetical protein
VQGRATKEYAFCLLNKLAAGPSTVLIAVLDLDVGDLEDVERGGAVDEDGEAEGVLVGLLEGMSEGVFD